VPNPGALGGVMNCNIANGLAAGALAEFGFVVLPIQEGKINITLTVSTTSNETNKANNSTAATVLSQRKNFYLPFVIRQ
jgi:hypothetical protein